MTTKFSRDMTYVLSFSKEEAERLHNDCVTPVHLLLGILRHGGNKAREILQRLQPDLPRLKQELEQQARQHQVLITPNQNDMNFDVDASRIMRICVLEARLMQSDVIDTEHILLAIMKASNNEASEILERMDITYKDLENATRPQVKAQHNQEEEDEEEGFIENEDDGSTVTASANGTAQAQVGTKKGTGKTPVLDNFGLDLTKAAADGLLDPVVGREKEIERVAQILCRRKKNNPILIGEPGVGKSAIVEGLAQRIVRRHISRALWDRRIVVLDMASVVAGTKYRGQFEERLRSIITELQKNPDVIVFIDEIHTIVGAGSAAGTMDAANMLKPALARGEFQCIGATTTDEYRKSIEKDGALERRFQKILVEPTTPEETLLILQNLKGRYEEHHHVTYTPEALEACVRLTNRYISDRSFPDKAIDAMDEAGSRTHIQDAPVPDEVQRLEQLVQELTDKKNSAAKLQRFEEAADFRDRLLKAESKLASAQKEWEESLGDERTQVDENMVAGIVSLMTGIPVQRIGQEENERLRQLEPALRNSVIGQDDAIRSLVRAIQRSRVGLKDPKRPIGTFMFVGPTGVGKTYLTKKLAEEMFGTSDAIIRIDMSEYMEKHTVSRMVGAPPGYVGYEEGGQLTEAVRRKPYSIVLLDEIEKAHPDVFNILLQVMDEGRLTDGNGVSVDFKNAIIIMTSNSGTRQIREFGQGIGFHSETDDAKKRTMSRDIIKKSLQKQFAPEFLNRVDDIIYFDQLDEAAIRKIVDIELRPLIGRVKEMGFTLDVTDEARSLLGQKGYDVQFGARPLKRAIQSMLEDPLCEVLMGNVPQGATLTAATENEKESIVIQVGSKN
ncbi:MAG: ATP-dependent Clp protease ATP-binding subunit [Bacteroidaceae bacterium]|nr:ATP-dependent Clp protease ATP-binding subunit [Bacteroidaceae bacterium]